MAVPAHASCLWEREKATLSSAIMSIVQYTVLADATVKEGPDKASGKVGTLKAGMVIDVVTEARANAEGQQVVQTITPPPGEARGGWIKLVTSKGKTLLQRVDGGTPPIAPGTKMVVAGPTPYFGQPENDPNVLGLLTVGSMIDVQQSMTDAAGRTKVKHYYGWSPAAAPDGSVLLHLPGEAPPAPAPAPAAEEGVPPAAGGAGGGAEPSGPPPGSLGPPPGSPGSFEPGGPPPPAGLTPVGGGGAYASGGAAGMGMAVVSEDKQKEIAAGDILKVGWIMKSSGGKKAADGAELVQIIEQWQQRLFTLGRDMEGVPMLCWYKNAEQYKARTPSNPNTGSFLALTTCRAEVINTGDMKSGATLEDDAESAGKRASVGKSSDLRKSQMGISMNSKQFVIITPQRNLKCEVVDPNDTASEWVELINSIAIDGAIARSGQKTFSLTRKLSQKTM